MTLTTSDNPAEPAERLSTKTNCAVPPARQVSSDQKDDNNEPNHQPFYPAWYRQLQPSWGEQVVVAEWEDPNDFRAKNGWKGRDLMHDPQSAVYIPGYYVQYGSGLGNDQSIDKGGVGTTLTSLVYFSERAESHPGYCHGGSMCAVMDDVIGWVGFMVTGQCRPWSGFTVKVNVDLQKPIPVHAALQIVGTVTRMERRKVYVEARLIDPACNNAQHAKAEGMVVLNRGILPPSLESQVSDISMG